MKGLEITEDRAKQLVQHAIILDFDPIQAKLALLLINEGNSLGDALAQAMHYHPGKE
jgi:hypothetical protein